MRNFDKKNEIEIIMLAAGTSSRMKGVDKLLLELNGEKLIQRTTKEAVESNAGLVRVVLGYNSAERRRALNGLPIDIIYCNNFKFGVGASIRAGIKKLNASVDAVIIALADMPFVSRRDFDDLIQKFNHSPKSCVLRAVSEEGTAGHPVLFPKSVFGHLKSLRGDIGAKNIFESRKLQVEEVRMSGDRALFDIDYYQDWENFKKRLCNSSSTRKS